MHAAHHPHIVIVQQVHLLYVQLLRQLTIVICKKELRNVRRLKVRLSHSIIIVGVIRNLSQQYVLVVFSLPHPRGCLISTAAVFSLQLQGASFLQLGQVAVQALERAQSESEVEQH